uniref:Uncharacterized protein n=1 Tax=Avena sativa TaxID=4498 RepID=A0ACD5ZJ32_AVESA
MVALRRLRLRRLAALHRLSRLFMVVAAFRRLRLYRSIALHRHLLRPLCFDDRSLSARDSTLSSSAVSLSAHEIAQLRCLLDAWNSSPTGSAIDFSSIERPPSPHPGTSSWILDNESSFHMTYDSSSLTYVRSVESHVRVLTADGTPLAVVSRGTLSTSSFHGPSVAHVPQLNMQLFSGSQIYNSRCSVTPDFDSCFVQDRHTGALLGASPRRHDGLWDLEWLRLPSAVTATSFSTHVVAFTSSFQQWHHRLGHLCGSFLSSLVHRGVLGSISGNASLDCLGLSAW